MTMLLETLRNDRIQSLRARPLKIIQAYCSLWGNFSSEMLVIFFKTLSQIIHLNLAFICCRKYMKKKMDKFLTRFLRNWHFSSLFEEIFSQFKCIWMNIYSILNQESNKYLLVYYSTFLIFFSQTAR